MKPMTTAFNIEFDPIANPDAQIVCEQVRFTLLTERLLRMEYSPDGQFEDRPSQAFWIRRLPVPKYELREYEGRLKLETRYMLLEYALGQRFTADSLRITLKDSGETWGQLSLSHLRDGHSGCAGSIVSVPRESGSPCLVLTAPVHNESGFDSRRDRKKFAASVSLDGVKTWPIRKLINDGPSGYSASVVGKVGGIYVLYEKGDKVYYDKGVSIVRLDREWLLTVENK